MAEATCAVCGAAYDKAGNTKTCGQKCSRELVKRRFHDYYYGGEEGSPDDGGRRNPKWSGYRKTFARRRLARTGGPVRRTCSICHVKFESADRRRVTCGAECSAANTRKTADMVAAAIAASRSRRS